MAQPTDYQPTVTLDADGHVATDISCLNCGYNLRTLSVEAVCPECAHPVRLSVSGQFLRFGAPQWVQRLSRGALLLVIAVATLIGGSVLMPMIMGVILAVTAPLTLASPTFMPLLNIGQFAFGATVMVLAMIGLWWLTVRDPAARHRPEGITARRVQRICTWLMPVPFVLALLMIPFWLPMTFTVPPASPFAVFTPTLIALVILSGFSSIAVFVTTPLALLRHLMGLMRRVPRPGLVRFARIEFWGALASGLLLMGAYAWMLVSVVIPMFSAPPTRVPVPLTGPGTAAPSGSVTAPGTPPSPGFTYTTSYAYTVPPRPTATTAPTSVPTTMMAVPSPPPIGVPLVVGVTSGLLGWCAMFGFVIAGFVLLILVQRALSQAAREAAQNAAEAQVILATPLERE
jgi:hypothetical protein